MGTNWKGIVQFGGNEDKRPLWQRRRTSPMSSDDSGAGTTTSGSRSSSADENRWFDDRSTGQHPHRMSIQSRTIQYTTTIRPIHSTNPFEEVPAATVERRSSSFRDTISPIMGGYNRHTTSPYNIRHFPITTTNRGASKVDHLTTDYVPKWRPDRRFSTPAVPRFRGSISRSPSPRILSKKGRSQFEYFRHRAASLPASNASLNTTTTGASSTTANKKSKHNTDQWPQTRSPSRVEQRFLELQESADYDKIRSFVIGAKGELVERGFCYRHRSSSSSPGSSGPLASPNEDIVIPTGGCLPNENTEPTCHEQTKAAVAQYSILVIGGIAVGKSSLLTTLNKCQQVESDEISNSCSVDCGEPGIATVVPVLICGEEVHLAFYEFSAADDDWTSTHWQAAVVMYSISDKRSFSAAADILYKLRAENKTDAGEGTGIPIILVGNKVDLERHRQVHSQDGFELARSYDCRFVDVSVELSHRVEDVLSHVMREIWQCTVDAYRQRQTGQSEQGINENMNKEPIVGDKKTKRFSLKKSKENIQGKPRSSRARSLYTIPAGLHGTLYGSVSAAGNASNTNTSTTGLLRLFGRRAVQSCEDLFSRLLRG